MGHAHDERGSETAVEFVLIKIQPGTKKVLIKKNNKFENILK
jgi:hypothetical protein